MNRSTIASSGVLVALIVLTAGCQTVPLPKKEKEQKVDPIVMETSPFTFEPADMRAGVQRNRARYPNLISSNSFAVWVSPELLGAKMGTDAMVTAQSMSEHVFVIECHMYSAFPDTSIAFDAIGFNEMDVYLETSGGDQLRPLQRVMSSPASQSVQGARLAYGRTNLLVFEKIDPWFGDTTIPGDVESVRLVLDGFNSSYHFEWPAKPTVTGGPSAMPPLHSPRTEEERDALRASYSALYSRLAPLAALVE